MLEADIIAHCAPTLAGIKTANMFTYISENGDSICQEVDEINGKLNSRDVYVEILRRSEKRALLYVYRKTMLENDLSSEGACALLKNCGYECKETACCIRKLQEKIFEDEYFPHEIGVFLGYPLDDVIGFIEQQGKNYKCCGIWKVYGDEQQSQMLFRKLKKCSEIYKRLFANGRTLLQLTVAA